jgi:hypothetical protein
VLIETTPSSEEAFDLTLERNLVSLSSGGIVTLSVKITAMNGFRESAASYDDSLGGHGNGVRCDVC